MKTFLEYVAADIIDKYGGDLSKTAVVFPNKRAALFINDYLARQTRHPLWSPRYITISDLFRQQSALLVGDPIKLVSELHKSYAKVTRSDETLDHFYGYGEIMVADFDDVDKNMADARKVFANVGSLKEMDDISYLSDEQRKTIERFFGAFRGGDTELRRRFLSLWNSLYDIYADYNGRLAQQGLAYEGMLYRKVASDGDTDFAMDRYLFVGFNLLSKVEQTLFDRLRAADKARFYWDYDTYYINDNEAGRYIKTYMERYPNELDSDNADIYSHFNEHKDITFVAASTEDIQARYISRWLLDDGGKRIEAGRTTAVVMCDEQLLTTAIHCIPDEVSQLNITTGYPLSQTPFAPLIASLIELRTEGREKATGRWKWKYVNSVMRHPFMRLLSPQCGELLKKINGKDRQYFIDTDSLTVDEGTKTLFAPENEGWSLTGWLTGILSQMAVGARNAPYAKRDPLFAESLFQTYKICNRLRTLVDSGDIVVDTPTLRRLIREIVRTTTIPFHGEPAVGVQLMGVLETRNIDFDHVLILSCNEGNMPKGVGDTSFIPYSIRKAYGLTTPDHKAAIYSYYFHRLLQRAGDITIAYNNTTSNKAKGEMSRYMLSLLVESPHAIRRVTLRAGSESKGGEPVAIEKDQRVMNLLMSHFDTARQNAGEGEAPRPLLTPTALNAYVACPLRFYYRYVAGLREPDNDDGTIDARTFGNIFHDAAMEIYGKMAGENNTLITKEMIEHAVSDKSYLRDVVDKAFRKNLFKTDDNEERKIEYNGLQLITFNVILSYVEKLLRIDAGITPFNIVGLERDVMRQITVKTGDKKTFTTTIGGRIDRMDSVAAADGTGGGRTLRIIDYKTGASAIKNAPKSVDDIFALNGDHADYYLQTILYADIARQEMKDKTQRVSPAIIFIQKATAIDYNPTLLIGKEPIVDVGSLTDEFETHLTELLNEIFNPSVPFTPTDNLSRCFNDKTHYTCPYTQLCGRGGK